MALKFFLFGKESLKRIMMLWRDSPFQHVGMICECKTIFTKPATSTWVKAAGRVPIHQVTLQAPLLCIPIAAVTLL